MPVENTEGVSWVSDCDGGRNLEDEYLLGDIIGRGTFSTVHKCLRKGRTEWTCKVLEKERLDRNKVKSSLPKLMKLKHPNIIKMKEAFETEATVQLITEYVRGGEIFEKIVGKGQFSERDAAQAVTDILEALKYLHEEGIVHGDVKPENLLYETEMDDSRLKVGDFGLIQLLSDKDGNVSNSSGTVRYCSPEVLLGEEPDAPADLWSLGVVMFIMLCGYEPFWGEGGESTASENIIHGDFTFSSPQWDDISDSAKELITKLLSVDPKNRPTAEEALNHPWTLGISTSSVPRDNMIKGLREYNARRRFRVATKAVLATRRAYHLIQTGRDEGKPVLDADSFAETGKLSNGSEQCKEFVRWLPGEVSADGHMTERKPLPLTTR